MIKHNFLLIHFLLLTSESPFTQSSYTNEFAVEIDGTYEEVELIASELNCVNKGTILPGVYLFAHNHVTRRSAFVSEGVILDFESHGSVKWFEQQKILSRTKRKPWKEPINNYVDLLHLDDVCWSQMWYLNRGGELDMNVQGAWLQGVTGKGISVSILDDGIEKSHPDLVDNYDPYASFDVNENDEDPTPRYDLTDSNRHGTRCAGEVAASANNSICSVGVAYEAGIGGVRMLDGEVTDAVEARSLSLNNQHVDIYSASWGPDDDGKTVDGPGPLAKRAFLTGINEGRGGKGNIFVWASGNGGKEFDNCNCDGYTNSIWTLSVSSATENGLIPWYSEACSSTLATTYSSGSNGERKVVTTDLHHGCTSTHTGTSASAPLAAGIIALVLQSNPALSWRDVQHLTIRCAHKSNLRTSDWAENAVGRSYSHSFGYGLMNASCMVQEAKGWKTSSVQIMSSISGDAPLDLIIKGKYKAVSSLFVKSANDIGFLEHVQTHVTLSSSRRGDVTLALISPSGTKSILLAKRHRDASRNGFNDWPFLTVHMWGESPIGEWKLEITNDGRSIVELKSWSLTLYGTSFDSYSHSHHQSETHKDVSEKGIRSSSEAPPSFCSDVNSENPFLCSVCEPSYVLNSGKCLTSCPEFGFYKGFRSANCLPCYYTCKTCNGSNDSDCLSCFEDASLNFEESGGGSYCYNLNLMDRIWSSSRWYYLLSLCLSFNFLLLLSLIVYNICCSKYPRFSFFSSSSSYSSSSSSSSPYYYPVKRLNSTSARSFSSGVQANTPFIDDTSSEEEEEDNEKEEKKLSCSA